MAVEATLIQCKGLERKPIPDVHNHVLMIHNYGYYLADQQLARTHPQVGLNVLCLQLLLIKMRFATWTYFTHFIGCHGSDMPKVS